MKRSVTVQIAGQKYALRTDADDRLVREVVSAVDAKFKQIQKTARTPDTQAVAILTALQIAEELLDLRLRDRQLRRAIRDKGKAILELLEREARV